MRWSKYKQAASLLPLVSLGLCGCGGLVRIPLTTGGGTGTPAPIPVATGSAFLTGNWQMTTASNSGANSFTSFAGFIYENTTATSSGYPITAVFQVLPGTCYLGASTIPAAGSVENANFDVESFPINGQLIQILATENAAATQLTGTYQVSGGCAGGDAGTWTGLRYQPLSGTYSGTVGTSAPAPVAALNLMQAQLGDGRGFSDVGGTATFTNISCFTTATLTAPNSYVVGSTVELNLTASDGETVILAGTFDQAATTLTITSVQISGGACSANLGAATLTHI